MKSSAPSAILVPKTMGIFRCVAPKIKFWIDRLRRSSKTSDSSKPKILLLVSRVLGTVEVSSDSSPISAPSARLDRQWTVRQSQSRNLVGHTKYGFLPFHSRTETKTPPTQSQLPSRPAK